MGTGPEDVYRLQRWAPTRKDTSATSNTRHSALLLEHQRKFCHTKHIILAKIATLVSFPTMDLSNMNKSYPMTKNFSFKHVHPRAYANAHAHTHAPAHAHTHAHVHVHAHVHD